MGEKPRSSIHGATWLNTPRLRVKTSSHSNTCRDASSGGLRVGTLAIVESLGAKVATLNHPLFGHSDVRLAKGEELPLGALKLRALHTPESTCYAVFIEDVPEHALGVFSGDTLFIGETGRTDVTDPKKTGEHAGQLYGAADWAPGAVKLRSSRFGAMRFVCLESVVFRKRRGV
jgi:hypothetical protein